jgi:ribonucleoside-diphosphate reductase beta chain
MTDVLDAPAATSDENPENEVEYRETVHPAWEAINWNGAPEFEREIWNKLWSQFWLPEKIPVSNDLKSWGTLTAEEKTLVMHVFTGLTKLDTVQGRFGAPSLQKDATSLFEEAIYGQIGAMEHVHSRSYSNIFSTLSNTADINASFRWGDENEYLLKKVEAVMKYYRYNGSDPVERAKKKIVSVFLESFLFYSGFFTPFWLAGQAKLTNTSDMIRLITRDEALHGYYIGAKFQENYRELDPNAQMDLQEWAYDILQELYQNELRYTQDLYDGVGWTEEVKKFLRYNANRALDNLGFDHLFPNEEVNPIILNGMDLTQESHDFFTGNGSSYVLSNKEDDVMDEDDWDLD